MTGGGGSSVTGGTRQGGFRCYLACLGEESLLFGLAGNPPTPLFPSLSLSVLVLWVLGVCSSSDLAAVSELN